MNLTQSLVGLAPERKDQVTMASSRICHMDDDVGLYLQVQAADNGSFTEGEARQIQRGGVGRKPSCWNIASATDALVSQLFGENYFILPPIRVGRGQ